MKEDIDMHESAFEMHGVKYLSPSQINLFISSPAKWLVNVAGYKDKIYKPAFTYGNAVEIGITKSVTEGISIKESLDLANEEFSRIEQEAKQSKSEYDLEGATKKQAHLKTTLETVIPVYKDLGKPIAAQKKVEHYLDCIPIPLFGILDLEYDHCVRDLKTTAMKPKMNSNYSRQLTVYHLATEKKPVIDYVYTTTKISELISFDVVDINMHKKFIENTVTKMMFMLSLSDDMREVCQLSNLTPDLSNDNWWNIWGRNEIEGAMKLFY